jgi:hypothetical protein
LLRQNGRHSHRQIAAAMVGLNPLYKTGCAMTGELPKISDDILKKIMTRGETPPTTDETVTREQLEERAKKEAEQEAQKVYDETYAEAYDRILEDLLGEYGFLDD